MAWTAPARRARPRLIELLLAVGAGAVAATRLRAEREVLGGVAAGALAPDIARVRLGSQPVIADWSNNKLRGARGARLGQSGAQPRQPTRSSCPSTLIVMSSQPCGTATMRWRRRELDSINRSAQGSGGWWATAHSHPMLRSAAGRLSMLIASVIVACAADLDSPPLGTGFEVVPAVVAGVGGLELAA